MEKYQIKIPVILPSVPDEKDSCIQRLIDTLQIEDGIDKIHVSAEKDNGVPQLCFHYNPDIISISRITSLAKQTGAQLTEKIGHKIWEVTGVRHTRHAKQIEIGLQEQEGIFEASVTPTGVIRVEYDTAIIRESEIIKILYEQDLQIVKPVTGAADKEHIHEHGGVFGANSELIFSIVSGLLLGVGFGLSFIHTIPLYVSILFYIGAYFFGGFYTTKEAFETIVKGGFEIDFLMLVAAIGAAFIGDWAEGSLLLFLFSIGHSLEHYAMGKAQKSIAALADLAPKTALLKKNNTTEEVGIDKLNVGDVIIIRPNTKISADGLVIKGQSSVNQAPITGESIPVEKFPVSAIDGNLIEESNIRNENRVFAGTINGNTLIEVKVLKLAKDSTLSRLVKLVNEAQTQKSPTQLFTDKFEKYFVPSVLALVVALNFAFLIIDEPFSASFYRAMAVLVAASPCALAISTPSAVLSAIARAARGGVLIKGGRPLEDLGELTAIAFDKTGTLTEGKPKLTHVIALDGYSEEKLLSILMAVESLSDHPLAKAIVVGVNLRIKSREVFNAENIKSVLGRGVKAAINGEEVVVGNLNLFDELDEHIPSVEIKEKVKLLELSGNTTMLVRKNKIYIGVIALMDTPRKEARIAVERLKQIGIKRMIMLTGDNQQVADAVAKEIGLTEAWGSLLPEAKVEAIKKLMSEEKKAAMVGDGVNDAPAMANSTVGIAMGAAGSDVALETADVALMSDKLENLAFAIGLSRKSKNIIKQNLWISLGVVALLIPLTIFGFANLGIAVIIHEGSTLVVVLNALRLLAYKQN
jgi:Cd2+/Zn2+-exporting ATPase